MRVELEYGRKGIEVELPEWHVVKCLGYRPAQPLADPQEAIRQRLLQPIGAPPLSVLAHGRRDACIVISDVTRPMPYRTLLPPLLAELQRGGIPREKTLILVATGLHRPTSRQELVEMVGPQVVADYRIENHDGHAVSEHTYLGDSPRGVPAWIDTRYLRADLKITTGLIEPHFMAGFSGGRKLICPGLAALPTIKVWHGPDFIEHPRSATGCLDGNPVHEENTRIALMAGCDFIVNVVIDEGRQILAIVAGDMEAAFLEGVEFVRGLVTDRLPVPADIVVTSAAGYPLDATYYQSIKGMVAALPILKPGGTIILAAEMSEGIGSPDFQRLYADSATPEIFMERILGPDYFVVDQWQLEEFVKVYRHARVVKVFGEGLPAETLRRLHVEPVSSIETAVAESLAEYGPEATIAVIAKGPYVMAEVG